MEVWGEDPIADDMFLKIIHKYFVYRDFRQHMVTDAEKHVKTFPGGASAGA